MVTLLTRCTTAIIETIGLTVVDTPLIASIDPAAPIGGPSLLTALTDAAHASGLQAAPVAATRETVGADVILRVGHTADAPSDARTLHLAANGWTGAVSPKHADVADFRTADAKPFGSFVAACLGVSEVFKRVRFRDFSFQPAALNAWTLAQASENLLEVALPDPGEPSTEVDHVLAGVGAVGSALLLALWSYRPVSGTIRAADDDAVGIDNTNLNRCVPFVFDDVGRPKAEVAAERLTDNHGLTITPTQGGAETLVGPRTNVISAVDTADARQALQDRYPASAVQASTEGLRVEMLRVDPQAGSACLRCFNAPRARPPDREIRAQIADMDDSVVAGHAAAVGTTPDQVREWGRSGGCGRIGDALLERLRPSDGTTAQFSVGFASVLAGTLLAAQVVKDAVRRAGVDNDNSMDFPLHRDQARFVTNLAEPFNGIPGVRRYGRDVECPACQGIRAAHWIRRWSG